MNCATMLVTFISEDKLGNMVVAVIMGILAIGNLVILLISIFVHAIVCNGPDAGIHNPCNDLLYCCHPDIFSTVTDCPNFNQTCPEPPGVWVSMKAQDLSAFWAYWLRMIIESGFFAMQVIFVFVALGATVEKQDVQRLAEMMGISNLIGAFTKTPLDDKPVEEMQDKDITNHGSVYDVINSFIPLKDGGSEYKKRNASSAGRVMQLSAPTTYSMLQHPVRQSIDDGPQIVRTN